MRILFILFTTITFSFAFGQYTAIPDPNFEQALIDLGYDDIIDGQVLTSNIDAVSTLNLFNKGISSLTGIEDFTSVTNLNCGLNQLVNLNLLQNSALSTLDCTQNNIIDLNLSGNPSLAVLYCSSNALTTLDLSTNSALASLVCSYNNNLTCLNIKNGNNANIVNFTVNFNPQLTCIEVDNVTDMTTWSFGLDSQTSFDEYCANECSSCLISATINQTGDVTLTANPVGLQYQWIDCSTEQDIAGENGQSFIATINGDYAVVVSDGVCSDTSDCITINQVSLDELSAPNKELIKVVDLLGREVLPEPNKILIYIYSDGTSERVFKLK